MNASSSDRPPPVVEMKPCPIVVVSGIYSVEKKPGGWCLFTFYEEHRDQDGIVVWHIVSRHLWPPGAVVTAIQKATEAMADTPLVADDGKIKVLN